MGQFSTLRFPFTFFLFVLAACKGEDELLRACSTVFHQTTPNGEPLGFHFSYAGGNRFRQLITGEKITVPLSSTVPLPASKDYLSSASPTFSCLLVFTASTGIHQSHDNRIVVRVSDMNFGSSSLRCENSIDVVRIYSIFRSRLFLIREFCGNDNYSPAIVTESNMAIVTITLYEPSLRSGLKSFHLNVESYKNIIQTVHHSTTTTYSIPTLANLNMYSLIQQQDREGQDWEKPLERFSHWEAYQSKDSKWTNLLSSEMDEWNKHLPSANSHEKVWAKSYNDVDWNVNQQSDRWKRLILSNNKTAMI